MLQSTAADWSAHLISELSGLFLATRKGLHEVSYLQRDQRGRERQRERWVRGQVFLLWLTPPRTRGSDLLDAPALDALRRFPGDTWQQFTVLLPAE